MNEIRIAPPTAYSSRMSDTLITTKVKSKMIGDEKVNAISTKVVTEYGVVYLMGVTKRPAATMPPSSRVRSTACRKS